VTDAVRQAEVAEPHYLVTSVWFVWGRNVAAKEPSYSKFMGGMLDIFALPCICGDRVFVPAVVLLSACVCCFTYMVQWKVHGVCGPVMPCLGCLGAQQGGPATVLKGSAVASGHVSGRGLPVAGLWSEDFADCGSAVFDA
jgi:hypothetical protein